MRGVLANQRSRMCCRRFRGVLATTTIVRDFMAGHSRNHAPGVEIGEWSTCTNPARKS
jgi:hypothetical protein